MYTIAIIGRPNVGKSALFNRLVGKRIAIVDPTYGLTRDRITATAEAGGKRFTLIDTGGIEFNSSDNLRKMTRRQSQFAIEQADMILFITDVQDGAVPLDREIAALLRKSSKDVIVVANKADNADLAIAASDFHGLGFEDVCPVSATHGLGIGELTEILSARITPGAEEKEEGLKISVVGKPNVGKSTFINAILREERMLVDTEPGTTRDSVDTPGEWGGRTIVLIDTAGMRHRKKIKEAPDYYSVSRSEASIRRCDVALLMLDAVEGVSRQDEKTADYVMSRRKGCVLAVNKWDLIKGRGKGFPLPMGEGQPASSAGRTARLAGREAGLLKQKYRKMIWSKVPFFNFVPVVFISARTGEGIGAALDTVFYVWQQIDRRIATPVLNRVLQDIWNRNEPALRRGKRPKFFYAAQTGTRPPKFACFVKRCELLDRSYISYLENGLRRAFGFEGSPIVIDFKSRG